MLRKKITKFYGENPKESPDFARIINDRNFGRVSELMKDIPPEKIVIGGETDRDERYIGKFILPLVPLNTQCQLQPTIPVPCGWLQSFWQL